MKARRPARVRGMDYQVVVLHQPLQVVGSWVCRCQQHQRPHSGFERTVERCHRLLLLRIADPSQNTIVGQLMTRSLLVLDTRDTR